jgi:GTP:adenosylcobinamide-phosphate guanylyltransferase
MQKVGECKKKFTTVKKSQKVDRIQLVGVNKLKSKQRESREKLRNAMKLKRVNKVMTI